MPIPPIRHVHQTQGDTVPIRWVFTQSVDGGSFELWHSLWGPFALVGSGYEVSFPITEARAAAAVTDPASPHSYTLVANPGVEGSERTAARGRWFVDAREIT